MTFISAKTQTIAFCFSHTDRTSPHRRRQPRALSCSNTIEGSLHVIWFVHKYRMSRLANWWLNEEMLQREWDLRYAWYLIQPPITATPCNKRAQYTGFYTKLNTPPKIFVPISKRQDTGQDVTTTLSLFLAINLLAWTLLFNIFKLKVKQKCAIPSHLVVPKKSWFMVFKKVKIIFAITTKTNCSFWHKHFLQHASVLFYRSQLNSNLVWRFILYIGWIKKGPLHCWEENA